MSDPTTPDRSIYVEAPLRLYRDWTPDLLRAAEIQADTGNLTLAADLCETMFGDDRIKAVLDTRTDSLLGLPLEFEASGDGRRGPSAIKALEADEDWYKAFPLSEQRMVHAWGVILGVGLAEIQWTDWDTASKGSKSRTLPRIVAKSPRNLRWDWEARTWKLRVTTPDGRTDEIPISPGDGKWIVYTPGSQNRPWVWGAWRALSRWALLKKYAHQDWGFYSERLGQGILVATGTGAGLSNDQRKQIASDLQSLGRNTALALPLGFDLKLIESVARSQDSFKAQIDCADNGYAIAILGQNLSTSAGATGNQGAASLHGRVALGRTRFDDESLSVCWREQGLTWWALFNFGTRELAPWPRRDTTPTDDLKEQASVVQQVGQGVSSLITAGAPVDLRALCEAFKIPVLTVEAAATQKAERDAADKAKAEAAKPPPPPPPPHADDAGPADDGEQKKDS